MKSFLCRFYGDESGGTMIEYALIMAFLAIVSIGTMSAVGKQVNQTFANIDSSFSRFC